MKLLTQWPHLPIDGYTIDVMSKGQIVSSGRTQRYKKHSICYSSIYVRQDMKVIESGRGGEIGGSQVWTQHRSFMLTGNHDEKSDTIEDVQVFFQLKCTTYRQPRCYSSSYPTKV